MLGTLQATQETATVADPPLTLTVSVVSSIGLVPVEAWDLCALEAAAPESANPFVTHAFLSSLEDSKSACPVSFYTLPVLESPNSHMLQFQEEILCLNFFQHSYVP